MMNEFNINNFDKLADNYIKESLHESKEDKFFRVFLPSVIKLKNKGASVKEIHQIIKDSTKVDIKPNMLTQYYSRYRNKVFNKRFQNLAILKNISSDIITINTELEFKLTLVNENIQHCYIAEKDLFSLPPYNRLIAKRYMYWYHIRDSELLEDLDSQLYDIIKPRIENIENIFRSHYLTSFDLLSKAFFKG